MNPQTKDTSAGRAGRGAVSDSLPVFRNPQAWSGPEMAARTDWIYSFSTADIEEIEAAVGIANRSGLGIVDLGREHFPLPMLSEKLRNFRHEALHGRGFVLMRGLPVERMGLRDAAIAYWGLGLYLGEAVSQNGKGHLLGHVKNLGLDVADPQVRGYQTTARLNFHCDFSDLVCLLCLKTSKSGGLSTIVSSTSLWNELVRRRPDFAQALMSPVYYTRWEEIPYGKQNHAEMRVFSPVGDRMVAVYGRNAIDKSQGLPGVPRLAKIQVEAMNFLETLASDPRFYFDMEFCPGDVQVLCNHFVFHARTSYEDWPEVEKRRHLLRLWLACDDGPELPAFLTDYSGVTAGGRPSGIWMTGVPLKAPLEA